LDIIKFLFGEVYFYPNEAKNVVLVKAKTRFANEIWAKKRLPEKECVECVQALK